MTKSMILIFSDARATIASAPSSPWARYCNLSLQEFWEKKPLHMKRDDPEYYKTLFSTKALDKVILEEMSSNHGLFSDRFFGSRGWFLERTWM